LFITSGTFEVFQDLVLRRCGEVMSDRAIPHINQPGLRDAVAADRASIGFLGKSELTPAVTAVSIGGECGLEVAPTSFNIKSEDYLLSRRLYVYTPSSVGRNGQAFLDFALSHPLAQEALKGGETTDQTIEVADIDNRAQRFAGLPENQDAMFGVFQRDTRGAQRFSLSFRFQFGSDRLDIKAEADILRLVDYLNRTRPRGEVLLAGFADSVGPAGENRLLAERRARSVRDAVAMIDRRLASGMAVKGYGEVMPVTCNDTDLGREKNRRVEVWLRSR
jgi:phosphate transport system substrate-binding protein